jgi:hypothetical protein
MKDNSETRGSTTGTQGNAESESTQQKKGSQQFANQANRPGNAPGRPNQDQEDQGTNQSRESATQRPAKSGPVASHAGNTGTGSGQISPQTHDTANAGRSGGTPDRGNQNS